MRQHDAAAAQPAPALGRVQHPKKDLLAASAALDSFNLECWYAEQAWVEARRPYTEALKERVRDCRLSETEDSLHAVQCAKAACAAFAKGELGARLKREVKLKDRAAVEAAEAWIEAEMAARADELFEHTPIPGYIAHYASEGSAGQYWADWAALRGNATLMSVAFARLWHEIRVVQPSGCIDPPRVSDFTSQAIWSLLVIMGRF